jgi:hypothetical protein
MAAELVRHFVSPPDYCFFVQGSHADLDQLEQQIKGAWSIIVGPRLLAFYSDGLDEVFHAKYSFTDPNEAMRFRLMV